MKMGVCATFSVHMQGIDGTDSIPAAFSGHKKREQESLQHSKADIYVMGIHLEAYCPSHHLIVGLIVAGKMQWLLVGESETSPTKNR
jgi:hypothetical protein